MAKNSEQTSSGDSVKPININGLSRSEKKFALCAAFQALPYDYSYSRKLQHMAKAQGISRNTVTQQATRYGWRQQHEEQVARGEANQATEGLAVSMLTVVEPVSPAVFLQELRSFTRAALMVSNQFTLVTQRMTELVIHQIQAHIATTETWDQLAWLTLDLLHKRLKNYIEPAKGFIVPGQIASLLNSLDFRSSLPAEDTDGKRFATVADLQKQLLELGVGATSNSEALAASFAQYEALPDIAAHRSDIT